MSIKTALLKLVRYCQIAALAGFLVVLGWSAYAVVHYLRTASRFEVLKLSVSGLKRVDENQVIAKAGFEVGTNVFKVNLEGIRKKVEQLQWVRYAMVERVLPDEIMIKVVEREPIGIARIRGEIFQFDADAMILNPDFAGDAGSFPVLDGLNVKDVPGNIRKIQTYQKVLEELGQISLSEVHINDAGEVSVVSASDPLLVNLGASDFRNRWIRYLQLKPQIQQQYPQAVRVDLRFKNQIIIRMKNEDDTDENISWGVEKKAL